MLKRLFLLGCVYLCAKCVGSGNVETRISQQIKPNKAGSSFTYSFGASLAVMPANPQATLFVGAPYYASEYTKNPPGALYRCPFSGDASGPTYCNERIPTAKTGAMGISMDVVPKSQEVAVCGSRYYFQCSGTNSLQRMIGVCYKAQTKATLSELSSPCTTTCPQVLTVDIIFVLDDSGSVQETNFKKALVWTDSVVKSFKTDIDNGNVRVGLIKYSADVISAVTLQRQTYQDLSKLILSTAYGRGGWTRTPLAIDEAVSEFRSFGRSNVPHLMIVVTDGNANGGGNVQTSSDAARASNITMVAVGVGSGINPDELLIIAGDLTRVLTVANFNNLGSILDTLRKVITTTAGSAQLEGAIGNITSELTACQLGFSTHTSKSTSNLYLGAAGSYDRAGSLASYLTPGSTLQTNPEAIFNLADLEKVFSNDSTTQLKDSYLGYAVTSGRFLGGNTEYVASGLPRYHSRGAVLITPAVPLSNPLTNYYSIYPPMPWWQLGAYFGHSVLAIDLNSDLHDDLIVSAPLYTNAAGFDHGQVFVFMNDPKNPGPAQWASGTYNPTVLTGSAVTDARFGMSITDLGDVDRDGYKDVAIGAPLEEQTTTSSGAIYIYYGSANGLSDARKQKILGSTVYSSLLRFGITVAKSADGGIDVDRNQYPDVIVAAASSDSVIVLRSRPVVDVTAIVTLNPTSIDIIKCLHNITVSCGSITVCISAKHRTGAVSQTIGCWEEVTPQPIIYATGPGPVRAWIVLGDWHWNERQTMTSTLSLDNLTSNVAQKRIVFWNSTVSTMTTASQTVSSTPVCKTHQIDLQVPAFAASAGLSSKALRVSYSFDTASEQKNQILSAIINPYASKTVNTDWSLNGGCKGNNACSHDLTATASYSIPPSSQPYIITATAAMLVIDVTISNVGPDHAKFTNFNISSPGLSLPSIISPCAQVSISALQPGRTVIVMNSAGSVLTNGQQCNIKLQYSLQQLRSTATLRQISIIGHVASSYATAIDPNSKNNGFSYSLPLLYDTNLLLSGVSLLDIVVFNHSAPGNVTQSLDDPVLGGNTTNVQHTYSIFNKGTNLLSKADVTFSWTKTTLDGFRLLYLYGFTCAPPNRCRCYPGNKVNILGLPIAQDGSVNLTVRYPSNSQAQLPAKVNCGTVSCDSIMCSIYNVSAFASVQLTANFKVWLPTVNDPAMKTTLSSSLRVNTSSAPVSPKNFINSAQVNTNVNAFVLFVPQPKVTTNYAAIIGAIIAGVALLCIAILGLWKFGFFDSKYGEMMKAAKGTAEVSQQESSLSASTANLMD